MASDTPLARYAVERNKIKSRTSHPPPRLFKPNKNHELSVYRTEGKSDQEIIEEGLRVVQEQRYAKRLYGWGELTRSDVCQSGLDIDDDDDPPGHSNIVGWPKNEKDWWGYQQELAARSKKRRLPEPIVPEQYLRSQ